MKILNGYAGIGGNRKLWGGEHDITAVEINPKIAECYKKLFPDDTVIVGDCHEYLREHFREFDFIWLSPPCPTHSVLQMTRYYDKNLKYPDMTLYQEILLLKHFFKGKWVIENVIPYYQPLIPYTFKVDRHIFWSSDFIMLPQFNDRYDSIRDKPEKMAETYSYDITLFNDFDHYTKRQILRNTVVPEIGKNIFDKLTEGING